MSNEPIKITSEGVVLTIQVQPRANKTEYAGLYGETALKFRVAAPPVGGAANDELCRFLSGFFRLSKNAVVIAAGLGGRKKRVLLKGLSVEQVKQRLKL